MKRVALLLAGLLLTNTVLAGTLYRWVDEKGQPVYSNQAPPAKYRDKAHIIRGGQRESMAPAQPAPTASDTKTANAALPEVVFYTGKCGATCDQAKALLDMRKIPYVLQDVQANFELSAKLEKLTGKLEVPVLTIGSNVHKGFDRTLWNNLLDAAGFNKKTPDVPSEKPVKP